MIKDPFMSFKMDYLRLCQLNFWKNYFLRSLNDAETSQ